MTNIQRRYEDLARDREPYLGRAREAVQLALPGGLHMDDSATQGSRLTETYSGFIPGLIMGLANKLTTAMVPPMGQAIGLEFDLKLLISQGLTEPESDDKLMLAQLEKVLQRGVGVRNWRHATVQEMIHIITAGTVAERITEDGNLLVYRLDNFVCILDNNHMPREVIFRELLDPRTSPASAIAAIGVEAVENARVAPGAPNYWLYTRVERLGDNLWETTQAVNDRTLADRVLRTDYQPVNVLGWSWMPGENYARSKVELHAGSIRSYEALSKSLTDAGAISAINRILIEPNASGLGGRNLVRRFKEGRNGDVIVAAKDAVSLFSAQGGMNLQWLYQTRQDLRQELAQAFASTVGSIRDAERVTRYEIAQLVDALDETVGGVYTGLNPIQQVRAEALIAVMKRQGQLPNWPKGGIEPTVLTGLRALDRERHAQNIVGFIQVVQGLPPEVQSRYPDWPGLLTDLAIAMNVPTRVKSQAQVAAEDEQAQINQLAGQATEQAMAAEMQQ